MSAFSYQQAKAVAQELKAKGMMPKVRVAPVKERKPSQVATHESMARLRAERRIAMMAIDPFYPRHEGSNEGRWKRI